MTDLHSVDVTISGGGMTGLLASRVVGQAGFSSVVFESGNVSAAASRDGRLLSISYKNQQALERWGVWNHEVAEPILSIRVVDAYSNNFVHLDYDLLGDNPLGYMVPASWFYKTIETTNLHEGTTATVVSNNQLGVVIEADHLYRSSLHIIAEGKKSKIPSLSSSLQYGQVVTTFNIKHSIHHHNVIVERFFPEGPFAILPGKGGFSSSIVWTGRANTAIPDDEIFLQELRKRVSHLGDVEIAGKIYRYDIGLRYAHNYSCGRILIMGDSSHSIHPLAGQGFNLTIGDLIVLEETLKSSSELGIDMLYSLGIFENKRKALNSSMIAITDGLNGLFSNNSAALRIIRGVGMNIVNKSSVLKKMCLFAADA